jgi:small subunit ribosomal protein S3Ae
MAFGKNKGLAKGGKKGNRKKAMDPFLKKVWYEIKTPTYLRSDKAVVRNRTMVTKTQGTKIETDGLKGRIAEFNLADLNGQPEDGFKKVTLEVMEIQGKSCLTDFNGMSLTRDKMCQMMKKKHSIVEAFADCKTTDGYIIRLFALGFTKRQPNQEKQFAYAQSAQLKKIRRKMVQIMQSEVAKGQLKDTVKALCVNKLSDEMMKQTTRIFPLDPVHIIKAKMIKKPKLDIVKLMENFDKNEDTAGMAVAEESEATNLLTASKEE